MLCHVVLEVVCKIVGDEMKKNYYSNPAWSSNAPPYRGWASDNPVNTSISQLNTFLDSLVPSAKCEVIRILYFNIFAFSTELANADLQINQYTYKFLTNVPVLAPLYAGGYATMSVSDWFNNPSEGILYWITTVLESTDPTFSDTSLSNAYYTLYPYINQLITLVPTESLEIVSRILYKFLIAPASASSSDGGASDLVGTQLQFSVSELIIFGGLLFNSLMAVENSLHKAQNLYDANTAVFPFTDCYDYIELASNYYSPLFTSLTDNVVSNIASRSALSSPNYWNVLVHTTPSARTSSVDINRIPGSLIPTLNFLRNVSSAVEQLSTWVLSNPGSSVPATDLYSPDFITAVTAIQSNIATQVTANIQNAINSMASQTSVHSARWNQDLNAI